MKVAALICNYNGKNFVINCIKSLLEQSINDFDIILADNASTDGTCEAVSEQYGEKVLMIRNAENLGGTGGFNAGMQYCMNEGYSHILLLDNDVVVQQSAVENLIECMNKNPEIGILGAKIMILAAPEYIQEYGSYIDMEKCDIFLNGRLEYDDDMPELLDCDFVPACAAMVRTDVIREVGIMPLNYFIYWDDIEFCHKIRKAGYKVSVCGEAKAWHRGAYQRKATTSFTAYYYTRNRIAYFLNNYPADKQGEIQRILVGDIFQSIYGTYYKMKDMYHPLIKSRIHALVDGFMGIEGKQAEKVYPIEDDLPNCLMELKGKILIYPRDIERKVERNNLPRLVNTVIKKIIDNKDLVSCSVCLQKSSWNLEEYKKQLYRAERVCTYTVEENVNESEYDTIIELYEHITQVEEYCDAHIYIDRYLNMISDEEGYQYYRKFDGRKEEFVKWFLANSSKKNLNYLTVENKLSNLFEIS